MANNLEISIIETKTRDQKINKMVFILLLIIVSFVFIFLAIKSLLFSLVFVAILATAIVFYQKPEIGIFLIVFSTLGGQLLKLNIGRGDTGLLASDLIIPFFLFVWFLRTIFKKEEIVSTVTGPFLFVFLSIAVLSLINGLRFLNQEQAVVSSFYLLRLVSYGMLFFVAATVFKENERGIYRFKKILILTFVLFALAGIAQIIYFPNLTSWAIKYGWDPHMGRLFSTFLDPNFAGVFLTIGFIFSISLLTYAKTIESKLILTLVSALELTAIILTYSRSTYLFLFISFFVLSILRSRKLLLVGIAAIIILLILFPRALGRIQGGFSIDESAKSRFESWGNTATIIRDYPLLGVGYNSFRYAQNSYDFVKESSISRAGAGSDSSILLILVTTGIFGLLSYLIFYLLALIKTKKVFTYSNSLQKRGFALALFSILIGLIFHSIFINSLLYPAIMIPFFIILGVISPNKEDKSLNQKEGS